MIIHNTKKIIFVINSISFFISHRLGIALEAKKKGYEVHLAAPIDNNIKYIINSGIIYHKIELNRKSKNLFKEFFLVLKLIKLFKLINPNLVHLVTIKPIIYGLLASKIIKIKNVVVAISGFGTLFISKRFIDKFTLYFVKIIYKLLLKHKSTKVIFQNNDDLKDFIKFTNLKKNQISIIKGSGVDLKKFYFTKEKKGKIIVALISRLLKHKGIEEFIESIRLVKTKNILNVKFWIVGGFDKDNPSAISESKIQEWEKEKLIEYIGFKKNIDKIIPKTHIIVLPSYREGLPKVLIEAAACGRPIITTDVPGCQDTVIHNKTGLIVKLGDIDELSNAIIKLILNKNLRLEFGEAGHHYIRKNFSLDRIIAEHIDLYSKIINDK